MTPLDLISLVQAKEYLKVDFADEDAYITSAIKSSIDQIERETGQRLYDRVEVINTSNEVYTTVVKPINAVTSITKNDVAIVLDTDYSIETLSFGKIFTFYAGSGDRVITLNVGYATGTCPELLRSACLNLIEYKFNNRGANDVPANIEQSISTFRQSPW